MAPISKLAVSNWFKTIFDCCLSNWPKGISQKALAVAKIWQHSSSVPSWPLSMAVRMLIFLPVLLPLWMPLLFCLSLTPHLAAADSPDNDVPSGISAPSFWFTIVGHCLKPKQRKTATRWWSKKKDDGGNDKHPDFFPTNRKLTHTPAAIFKYSMVCVLLDVYLLPANHWNCVLLIL